MDQTEQRETDLVEDLDRLDMLFKLQKRYMDHLRESTNECIPEIPADLSERDVQVFCRDIISRCQDELFEVKQLLKKGKPHRNIDGTFSRAHLHEEFADALHYFLEILIIADVSPSELFTAYVNKNVENHQRIVNEFEEKK